MDFHPELFSSRGSKGCDECHSGAKRQKGIESLRAADTRPHADCHYFGSGAVPVTVNPASDFASVSCGWAPPTCSAYLPGRMARFPWSSTLDSERGSIFRVTSLLAPGARLMRSNATREWIGPPCCGVFA